MASDREQALALFQLGAAGGEPLALRPRSLKFYAGSLALLVLAVAAAAAAAWTWSGDKPELAIALGVAGLLFASIAGLVLWRREAGRATVQIYERGFSFSRWGKTRIFPFDEVVSVCLRDTEEHVNGVPQGRRRRLRLRSQSARLKLDSALSYDQPDELGAWLRALLEALGDAAARRLDGGRTLEGQGWKLSAMGLQTGRERALPISGLAAVGTIHASESRLREKIAVWRAGEAEPFFSVGAETANALILEDVLSRRIAAETPADTGATGPESTGFGRLVFERRVSRVAIGIAAVLGAGLAISGLVLLAAVGELSGIGVLMLALGLGVTAIALLVTINRLRCYERAVVRRTVLSTRTVAFDQVERMSYRTVDQYLNGAYVGTNVTITLAPINAKRKLKFSATVKGGADDLESLRNYVAGRIAERLYARLQVEGEIAWGSKAWISRRGLRFNRRKLTGRTEELRVDFSDRLRTDVVQGKFRLFVPARKKPIFTLACGGDNFYPGLFLFQRLAAEAAAG